MDELYRKLLAQAWKGTGHGSCLYHRRGRLHSAHDGRLYAGRPGRTDFRNYRRRKLEYQAVLHAQELVQEKKSEYREYDLGTGEGKGLGMVCGAE